MIAHSLDLSVLCAHRCLGLHAQEASPAQGPNGYEGKVEGDDKSEHTNGVESTTEPIEDGSPSPSIFQIAAMACLGFFVAQL